MAKQPFVLLAALALALGLTVGDWGNSKDPLIDVPGGDAVSPVSYNLEVVSGSGTAFMQRARWSK